MRDRSRRQVVPARLLGQPLSEVFGTETVDILHVDASGIMGVCRGSGVAAPILHHDAMLSKSLDVGGDDGHVVRFVGDVEENGHTTG